MSDLTNTDSSSRSQPRPNRDLPQLSNADLLKDTAAAQILFPGGVLDPTVDSNRWRSRQRIVLPKQFIAADKNLGFLKAGMKVTLNAENDEKQVIPGQTYQATVIQARQFEPDGKRYVLLESAVDLIALEGAKNVRITANDEKNVPVNSKISPNSTGIIHPGGANGGGGQVHAGGQSNAYGVSNLIHPSALVQEPLPAGLEKDRATFETDAKSVQFMVAVLDTGLLFQNPPTNRQPVKDETNLSAYQSSSGWDFINRDAFPVDDHPQWHGTKISSILKRMAQQSATPHMLPVREFGILPVRVANQYGVLTLYDAICALAYAKSKKVRLVNASWSFTGLSTVPTLPPREEEKTRQVVFLRQPSQDLPDYPLLYQAIKDLRDDGIMVAAAAGNRSQYPFPPYEIGVKNAPKIYPACYSPVLDNVITVTTVSYKVHDLGSNNVGRHFIAYENYSPKYVDTGVLTNAKVFLEQPDNTQIGNFVVPGFSTSQAAPDTFRGTSYATPYLAGRLAKLMAQPPFNVPGKPIPKNTLMAQLSAFLSTNDLDNVLRKPGYYPAG